MAMLVFVPASLSVNGDHLAARLMVVPAGASVPPGVMRLSASSGSSASPGSGFLRSPSSPSTASARGGLLRASSVRCASPFVHASGAAPRSIYSTIRAPEPPFLAPYPQASRRSKTVAYGTHDPATGAGDDAEASNSKAKDDSAGDSKENSGVYEDDSRSESTAKNPKAKDDAGSGANKENGGVYKDHGGSDSSTKNPKDNDGGVYKDHRGAGSSKVSRKGSNDHGGAGSGKSASNDDVADGSAKAKDDIAGASKEKGGCDSTEDDGSVGSEKKSSKDHVADGSAKDNPEASKDGGGVGSENKSTKDDVADGSAKENPEPSKDSVDFYFPPIALPSFYLDSKDDVGARSPKDNSKVSNDDKDLADDAADDGALQGRVDPRMIVAQLDIFALDYDPMDNVYHISTISYDIFVRREFHSGMKSCNHLLLQAMNRRPPLAEHSKVLVFIGRSFRVVSMEARKGFVQSSSVLTAIEALKAMGIVFLGPYIGFHKPLPNREFPFKPPAGSGEKLYFRMLLDYYHTVFECVRSEIITLFAMDGHDDNFDLD